MTRRERAEELLKLTHLPELLQKHGKAFIVGSCRMDAMAWNDLDIYLDDTDLTVEGYHALAAELLRTLAPTRFDGFLRIGEPCAFLGLETALTGERWNIDLWWKNRAQIEAALSFADKKAAQMRRDPALKTAVLDIKQGLA